MQNRYTGDIGDFAKYGLLRHLCQGRKLGVAWYLYPDEAHNEDGKYTKYLNEPEKWRHLDPDLFDGLQKIVKSGLRDIREIEYSRLLENAIFSNSVLSFEGDPNSRKKRRIDWFHDVLRDLNGASIIFSDPDNGLYEDQRYDKGNKTHWKRIPLSEVRELTRNRIGIIYHHNSRRPGGHIKEIRYWMSLLGPETIGLYWRRISNRTFFIVNPSDEIKYRAHEFVKKWAPHIKLINSSDEYTNLRSPTVKVDTMSKTSESKSKVCPECGLAFKGTGWCGIDAHWKAQHRDIMLYEDAWPLIKSGKKPSAQ